MNHLNEEGSHYYNNYHKLTIVEAAACIISALTCFLLAIYLLIYRRSKIHYRLAVGLCIAFTLTNVVCVLMSLWMQVRSATFYAAHLSGLTLTCKDYLLKTVGYTEEELTKRDLWIHPIVWILGGLYMTSVYFEEHEFHAAFGLINLVILVLSSSFIVISTIYIIVKQRRMYARVGEVNTPLISSRNSEKITKFQIRLIVLCVLALCTCFNVPLILFLSYNMEYGSGSTWARNLLSLIIMACALTGFCVSILLATAPELKR